MLGKYIYIVSENRLIITDAYPAEDAKIIFKTSFGIESQNLQNMFLNDDMLIVFHYGTNQEEIIPEFDFEPNSRHRQIHIVFPRKLEPPKIFQQIIIFLIF